MNNNPIEILAPSGNTEMLKAAVLSGADAVYFGLGNFNARRSAKNFTDQEVRDSIEYCHRRGVKVHITLNTLIKDSEIDEAVSTIKKICEFGADAVIVQDLGAARLIKQICPEMEMHASTQLSTGTAEGLELLKELGFKRAVLPRELSFDEIKELCKASPLELEVFVHGALCMCVSGQCLMSAVLGSRSGNRGLCAQPCRLPFKADNGTGRDLSLKDLSLIEHINELHNIGITSFKIEGRMKRPEYVSAAVSACKKAVEGLYDANMRSDLEKLFSRSGFTDGYYTGSLGRNMFGYREKENVQGATKELLGKYAKHYEKEAPRFAVDFLFDGELGEKASLTASCNGYLAYTESDCICEAPVKRPISSERIIDALSKTGGTQFAVNKVEIDSEPDYSLPVSALNSMRRQVLNILEGKIGINKDRKICSPPMPSKIKSTGTKQLVLRFDSVNQITPKAKKHFIIVPLEEADNFSENSRWGVEIPHGLFGNSKKVSQLLAKCTAEYALCHTLDAVSLALKHNKKPIASPSFNILNSYGMDTAKSLNINSVIVSNECTLQSFSNISAPIPKGITVYGHIPLMLTRNCPIKNGKNCAECKRNSVITDRKGISFPVKCRMGYSEILNSRPIYMGDRMNEIPDCDMLLFYFSTENNEQVDAVLSSYENQAKPSFEYTRGLLYRGVE